MYFIAFHLLLVYGQELHTPIMAFLCQPKLQLEKSPFTYKVSKTIFRQGIATLPAAVATGMRLSCFHIPIFYMARLSRGLFRRFLRYVQMALEYSLANGIHEISLDLVKKAIDSEEITKIWTWS